MLSLSDKLNFLSYASKDRSTNSALTWTGFKDINIKHVICVHFISLFFCSLSLRQILYRPQKTHGMQINITLHLVIPGRTRKGKNQDGMHDSNIVCTLFIFCV